MNLFKVFPSTQKSFFAVRNADGVLGSAFRTKLGGVVVPLSSAEWEEVVARGERSACLRVVGRARRGWRVDSFAQGQWKRDETLVVVSRGGRLRLHESTSRV